MTDPSLASLAGTTKQQIFKLRRGERKLTVQWARRLAPYLAVEWYELVDAPQPSGADQARTALLTAFEKMSDEQRQALLTMAEGVVDREPAAQLQVSDEPAKRRAVGCAVLVVRLPRR